MQIVTATLAGLIFLHLLQPIRSACNYTTIGVQDTVFFLSDDLVDGREAEKRCSSLGGLLASTADIEINKTVIEEVNAKYLTERLWIFYNILHPKIYKYSTTNETGGDNWKSPNKKKELWYFDLYKKPGRDRVPIYFYFAKFYLNKQETNINKWFISSNKFLQGWKLDKVLYGWKDESDGHMRVESFMHDGQPWTSKLMYRGSAIPPMYIKRTPIFAPESNMGIFVGAQFEPSLRKWKWSDGSLAKFTTDGLHGCQQKALNYDNGWKLINKNCSDDVGYYICQTKLLVSANSGPCNSSTVQVNWQSNINKAAAATGHELDVKVDIHGKYGKLIQEKNAYNNSLVMFNGLETRTIYSVKVTAKFTRCTSFSIVATTNVTTGLGSPDPLTSARVVPVEKCVVNFSLTTNQMSLIYHIAAFSPNVTTHHNYSSEDLITGGMLTSGTVTVPLDEHEKGSRVNLSIAVGNCEGISVRTKVEGYCFVSDEHTKPPELSKIIGPVVGSLSVILLLLTLFSVVFYKKSKRKSQTSLEINATTRATVSLNELQSSSRNVQVFAKEQNRKTAITQHVNDASSPAAPTNILSPKSPAGKDVQYENFEPKLNVTKRDEPTKTLYDIYLRNVQNKFAEFETQFQRIVQRSKINPNSTKEVASKEENGKRNRYKNILPYDHARVHLNMQTGNDYINASFLPGYHNEHKFIATQGPKLNTIKDFWLMVYQQSASVIVMLTQLVEGMKSKCKKYWPSPGCTDVHDEISVTTIEENIRGGIIERKMKVTLKQRNLNIVHFQYTSWPDHGIPETTSTMIYMREMVEATCDQRRPIVVHCSDGCGRTGTYIAMDVLFDQLEKEGKVDVEKCVLQMRENRMEMVQTSLQFTFIYKLVLEHQELPNSGITTDLLQSLSKDQIESRAVHEFELLSKWRFGKEWRAIEPDLQTYKNNELYVHNENSKKMVKLNASRIQNLLESSASKTKESQTDKDLKWAGSFIVAEMPEVRKEESFWKMAIAENISTIVCVDEKGLLPELATEMKYGKMMVNCDINQNINGFQVMKLIVSSPDPSITARQITMVHLTSWKNEGLPPAPNNLVDVVNYMQSLKAESTELTTLICCKNGCSKSGTLLAIANILERLKIENKVDVFRTVKDLRDMKPNMVDKIDLYKYCYSFVMEYLASFSAYFNYK